MGKGPPAQPASAFLLIIAGQLRGGFSSNLAHACSSPVKIF